MLLMDEPFAALDVKTQAKMQGSLLDIGASARPRSRSSLTTSTRR
jgi:ABC-type nitrate/sulfonate/bicarbonate transport system ATPase subunit